MSAVSNRLTPRSSAAATTSRVCSPSMRRPKLLQPMPIVDTISPDAPSRRNAMLVTDRSYRRSPTSASALAGGANAIVAARLGRVSETRAISDILQREADCGRIGPDEALLLYTDAPLHPLGEAADAVRRRQYP